MYLHFCPTWKYYLLQYFLSVGFLFLNHWQWFECYLTYGNSLLPEAMLCAFISTSDHEYKVIAKESFDFLLSKIFETGRLTIVSNKGWLMKNNKAEKKRKANRVITIVR